MTDMIERVARAVIYSLSKDDLSGPDELRSVRDFNRVFLGGFFDLNAVARAAIEAMREPTEGMRHRGDAAIETASACDNIWDYMIEAALADREPLPEIVQTALRNRSGPIRDMAMEQNAVLARMNETRR